VIDTPRALLANKQLLTALSSLTILVPQTVVAVTNTLAILQQIDNQKLKVNIVLTSEHLPKRAHLLSKTDIEQLLGRAVVGNLEFESRISLNIDMGNGPRIASNSRLHKLLKKLIDSAHLRTSTQLAT
jgi:hypothetical protein